MRVRREVVLLVCLAIGSDISTKAQELLEDPAPAKNQTMLRVSMSTMSHKGGEITALPKSVIREQWWKLDKDVTALGIIHVAGALTDGVTTRRFVTLGYAEGDPVDRLFLGQRPGWSRMIPFGGLEVYGAALLAQRMKHSKFKVARRLYLAPQIAFIAIHAYETGNNIIVVNATSPQGY